MTFRPSVERWRALALTEAQRNGLPVNTILANIQRESGGAPGAVSSVGAVGLMQTRPSVIDTFNASHKTAHTPDEVRTNPALGIKIGAWLFALHYGRLKNAASSWDRFALADVAYSQGWGTLQKLIADSKADEKRLSWEWLKAFRPDLGKPERPWDHSRFVANNSTDGGPAELEIVSGAEIAVIATALIVGVIIILVVACQ